MIVTTEDNKRVCWYVMRDLKRSNARTPAYKQLEGKHIEVFTPMRWRLRVKNGKREREQVPFMQDLLFVHDAREVIDPIVDVTPTLQYRFRKGSGYCNPMTVNEPDMERFIRAVRSSDDPKYYLPGEITSEMCKRRIRIVGGALDGYEGLLLSVRGSKTKRLLVELPGLLTTGVEVNPEMIEILD